MSRKINEEKYKIENNEENILYIEKELAEDNLFKKKLKEKYEEVKE